MILSTPGELALVIFLYRLGGGRDIDTTSRGVATTVPNTPIICYIVEPMN